MRKITDIEERNYLMHPIKKQNNLNEQKLSIIEAAHINEAVF